MLYTGEPCDWVLGGTSGHKTLLVRFGAQDGSVSPIVKSAIDVDTTGPITAAGSVTRAGADRHAFRFVVRDAGSPQVSATIVVRGHGATRRSTWATCAPAPARPFSGSGFRRGRTAGASRQSTWPGGSRNARRLECSRSSDSRLPARDASRRRCEVPPGAWAASPGRRPSPRQGAEASARATTRNASWISFVALGREVRREFAQQVCEVRLPGAGLLERPPGDARGGGGVVARRAERHDRVREREPGTHVLLRVGPRRIVGAVRELALGEAQVVEVCAAGGEGRGLEAQQRVRERRGAGR